LHNNITPNATIYGGNTVTYRRLYLILCERFNNKEYFVDTYFKEVYPYTMKEEVDVALQTVKDELRMYKYDVVLEGAVLTKKGNLDKRYKQNIPYNKALQEYETFKENWEDEKGEELASLIAEDIKASLANGMIRLNLTSLEESTQRKRIRAGYDPNTVFYAMGDLIDHIQIQLSIRS
jgi:hypothetical protein